MSEATPFIELPVSYRVMAVEDVRQSLRGLAEKIGQPMPDDLALSKPAEAWLKRLRSALCDPVCTTAAVAEMNDTMRGALPAVEYKELERRLAEFSLIRDQIPHAATKADCRQERRSSHKRRLRLACL